MKKAEDFLREEFVDGEYDELMSQLNTDITPSLVSAMKKYALQFVNAAEELIDDAVAQDVPNYESISYVVCESLKSKML